MPGLTVDLLEAAVRGVPGAGLLRDGQKWVAWWALPLAVGAGLGARRLAGLVRERGPVPALAGAVAGAAVLLPLIATPDLVWGVGGRLQPVAYPGDWQRVRDALAADRAGRRPRAAVRHLPRLRLERRPPAAGPGPALAGPPHRGGRRTGRGRGGRRGGGRAAHATVAAVADDPGALAGLGIGYVLVERGTAGRSVPDAVTDLPVVVAGQDLELYRVPDAEPGPSPSLGRVTAVVLAHACALGTVAGAVLWITTLPSTVTLRRRPLRKRVPE